jgi:transcriptional regulator with PAS, ATPase and Fis domain
VETSRNIRSGKSIERDFLSERLGQCMLDDFIEQMTGDACLTLLKWARIGAPRMLRTLMASYLLATYSDGEAKKLSDESSVSSIGADATGAGKTSEAESLRMAEREHILRVLSESKTLGAAAAKLGIHSSTLWRKRKQYGETRGRRATKVTAEIIASESNFRRVS